MDCQFPSNSASRGTKHELEPLYYPYSDVASVEQTLQTMLRIAALLIMDYGLLCSAQTYLLLWQTFDGSRVICLVP